MKKPAKYLLVALIGLLLISSCAYELEDIDLTIAEENQVDFTDFNLSLNGLTEDILIYKRVNLEYIIDGGFFDQLESSGKFVVYVNDEKYRTFFSSREELPDTIVIDFSPSRFQDGNYKLSIVAEWEFNNESLAGQLEYQYQLVGEWDIIIDRVPDPISITNFFIEEGELWVEWEAPEIASFDNYLICSDATGSERCVLVDRECTKARYPYFLVGQGDFKILTVTESTATSEGPISTFELNEEIITLSSRDSSIYMTVRQPTLYSHVLFFSTAYFILDTIDFQEREFELVSGLLFGEEVTAEYNFRLGNEDTDEFTYSSFSGGLTSSMGISLPQFDIITYSAALDSYFAKKNRNGDTYLYKMDGALNLTDTLILDQNDLEYAPMAISPSGDVMALVLGNTLYKINPATLSIEQEINMLSDYGYEYRSFQGRYGSKITTNGWLFIRASNQIVIDLATDEMLFFGEREGGIVGQNGDISDDGRYLFSDGDLYEFNAGGYEFVSQIDTEFKSGVFLNDTELMHFNSSGIDVIDATTQTITNSIVINHIERTETFGTFGEVYGGLRLNETRDRLISHLSDERIEIYDFNGVKLDEYLVNLNSPFYYHNGFLFAGIGQAIQIDIP